MTERIRKIAKDRCGSVSALARAIGKSQANLDQYINGRVKIPLALVEAILEAFPEVSAEWLMRGKGQMIQGDQPTIMGDNSGVVAGHIEGEAIAQGGELPSRLLITRDLFLFQCYTGMAWADIATLDRSMIQTQGADTFISRSRKKTHVHYRTKLLTPALDVMKRHNMSVPMPEHYSKYHKQLHKVIKLAGIDKNVNSHVGRHTFATWALSHGVPIEIVSKMLGHTKIETTQIYAKVLAKDVEAQFDKLDELFTEK